MNAIWGTDPPEPPPAPCPFCEIVAGRAPGEMRLLAGVEHDHGARGVLLLTPLNPVVDGHQLVIPATHVPDATVNTRVFAEVMRAAAKYARVMGRPFNLITSAGSEATQTVFHLHVHYVPRAQGDGLPLPWTPQQEAALVVPRATLARWATKSDESATLSGLAGEVLADEVAQEIREVLA